MALSEKYPGQLCMVWAEGKLGQTDGPQACWEAKGSVSGVPRTTLTIDDSPGFIGLRIQACSQLRFTSAKGHKAKSAKGRAPGARSRENQALLPRVSP